MKQKSKAELWIAFAAIALIYVLVTVLEQTMDPNHIIFTVLKKGAIYSLVAVSMNLLNGFTGLFSLGQAGFMLLGAYSYAVLCIPVAKRAGVYQYFDGGIVKFSLPEIFASFLGDKVGSAVGMILALLVGGLIAAAAVSGDAAGPSAWIAKGAGVVAVTLASVNIFGGSMVTRRMLAMYKKKERPAPKPAPEASS